jgi:hypothetical protein
MFLVVLVVLLVRTTTRERRDFRSVALLQYEPIDASSGRALATILCPSPTDRIAMSYKLPYVPQRKSVDKRTWSVGGDCVWIMVVEGTNGIRSSTAGCGNNFIPHRRAMEKCPPCARHNSSARLAVTNNGFGGGTSRRPGVLRKCWTLVLGNGRSGLGGTGLLAVLTSIVSI